MASLRSAGKWLHSGVMRRVLFFALLACASCGSVENDAAEGPGGQAPQVGGVAGAGAGGNLVSGGEPSTGGREPSTAGACSPGDSRPCHCLSPVRAGAQSCTRGSWGACVCAPIAGEGGAGGEAIGGTSGHGGRPVGGAAPGGRHSGGASGHGGSVTGGAESGGTGGSTTCPWTCLYVSRFGESTTSWTTTDTALCSTPGTDQCTRLEGSSLHAICSTEEPTETTECLAGSGGSGGTEGTGGSTCMGPEPYQHLTCYEYSGGGWSCLNGTCTRCTAGMLDCDMDASNWCETIFDDNWGYCCDAQTGGHDYAPGVENCP